MSGFITTKSAFGTERTCLFTSPLESSSSLNSTLTAKFSLNICFGKWQLHHQTVHGIIKTAQLLFLFLPLLFLPSHPLPSIWNTFRTMNWVLDFRADEITTNKTPFQTRSSPTRRFFKHNCRKLHKAIVCSSILQFYTAFLACNVFHSTAASMCLTCPLEIQG